MPVAQIHPLVDEIHIMTYDHMDGNWGLTTSGHHTNLRRAPYCTYSVEEATAAWLGYGVPSTKLWIGAALYSRGFANTDGIGKPCKGGSPDKSWEDGIVDYKALPLPGAVEKWDEVAHAAYSYDSSRRVLNSYDNVQSVKEKCQFVHDNNLGGIIVWESSGDRPYSDSKSIMRVLHDCLTHGKPTDVKSEPKVIPTPPGGKFTPATGGGVTPPLFPLLLQFQLRLQNPVPSPVVPVPTPAPQPAPSPSTGGPYPCDFCEVCTKDTNTPCVSRDGSSPSPAPAPQPSPAPQPAPSPQPAPAPSGGQEWTTGKSYSIGDRVTYKGKNYKCQIAHTSISVWAPDLAAALWASA